MSFAKQQHLENGFQSYDQSFLAHVSGSANEMRQQMFNALTSKDRKTYFGGRKSHRINVSAGTFLLWHLAYSVYTWRQYPLFDAT
jgi:hypothetical protein